MQKEYNKILECILHLKKYSLTLNVLLSVITSSLLLGNIFLQSKTSFENLALNKDSTSLHGVDNSKYYFCKDLRDANNCITGTLNRKLSKKDLWLGNSQIDAINQFKNGQKNSPIILHELLLRTHEDLIAFSEPNASFQEHYVLFEYLSTKLNFNYLILPLVFDDTRESGIRSTILPALKDSAAKKKLSKTTIGKQILLETSPSKDDSNFSDIKKTPQEAIEKSLDNWLNKNWELWNAREKIRGNIFLLLYQLRNTIFNIKPESKRRIIKGRYLSNLSALEEILITAKNKRIVIVAYIAPIRSDVPLPYETNEYIKFKSDVESLVKRHGGYFYNLENIIPGNLWGKKDSTNISKKTEIDYMHFKYKGHEILANKLFSIIKSLNRKSNDI